MPRGPSRVASTQAHPVASPVSRDSSMRAPCYTARDPSSPSPCRATILRAPFAPPAQGVGEVSSCRVSTEGPDRRSSPSSGRVPRKTPRRRAHARTIFRLYARLRFINNWDLSTPVPHRSSAAGWRTAARVARVAGPLEALCGPAGRHDRHLSLHPRRDHRDAIRLATILVNDTHDLIHKRSAGFARVSKRASPAALTTFLNRHAPRCRGLLRSPSNDCQPRSVNLWMAEPQSSQSLSHKEHKELPLIQVSHLTKRYGQLTAVDDFSFDVQTGEIVGLIGTNCAGTTSTLRCLVGIRAPDRGHRHDRGHDIVSTRWTPTLGSPMADGTYLFEYATVERAPAG